MIEIVWRLVYLPDHDVQMSRYHSSWMGLMTPGFFIGADVGSMLDPYLETAFLCASAVRVV